MFAGDLNNKVCVDATEVTGNPDSCSEAVVVTVPPVCPTNPNLPFDSPDCKVCEYNRSCQLTRLKVLLLPLQRGIASKLHLDCKSLFPVTPTTLVNTGTGVLPLSLLASVF